MHASSQLTVDRLLKSMPTSYSVSLPQSLAKLTAHFGAGKPIPEKFRRCGWPYARRIGLGGERLPPFLRASYEYEAEY